VPPRADKYRFGLVPKRHFDPAGPLFATRRLVFRGVTYERGDRLPDDIRKGKRFALWHSNRATNTPVVHFDRRGGFVPEGVSIARKSSPASAAPAAPSPAATAQVAAAGSVSLEAFEAAAQQLATEGAISGPMTPEVAEVVEQVIAAAPTSQPGPAPSSKADRHGRRR
jgi:hypothetical protein